MYRILIGSSIFLMSLSACTNNEAGNSKNINPDAIFFDYKIRGEEKDSDVTVYIQYRMGGPNGTTLVLNDPAKVELDGETIPVDSALLTGAYYESRNPSSGFVGKHALSFTDVNEKQYKEEFIYQPFKLKKDFDSVVHRGDLAIDFEGLGPKEAIRLTATDTSFMSWDINEIDTAINGHLVIPRKKLNNLVNGPIILLLSKETETPLKNGTKRGGRIVVSYGLQRDFVLKE